MIFNSINYLVFLPLVVLLYYGLPHRMRWAVLLAASYFFYMCWNAQYAILLAVSTVVPYLGALVIARSTNTRNRRATLVASLGTNLGLLVAFKYWEFFAESADWLGARLGVSFSLPTLDVLLPVGISFYTFQTISYTVDVYCRRIDAEKHLGRFALYVSFFPQLVAGPIERASRLLPQFYCQQHFDFTRICLGCQLILWGLFKKVVIADRLAIYVDSVYNSVGYHECVAYLLATYAFAFQIYCDFSGYSDIAIGSAALLGIRLVANFRQPYFATNLRDFWRRWHISLSTWLRDYVYIPIGGSRRGKAWTVVALMITMLLGGLWHGASWTYVIWGGLHGLLLVGSRATLDARNLFWDRLHLPHWLRDTVRIALTFHLVCLCWVFFRAKTLADAMTILGSFFQRSWALPGVNPNVLVSGLLGVLVLAAVQILQLQRGSCRRCVARLPLPVRWSVWYGLIFAIVLLGVQQGSQFIYFQF
ncbi:MAG: MBOAT family protein [Candidatus Nealsonbacteria bacterium]|nr:MBOAT family protein [Candidatus Nealsonbacteria bacterium]